MVALQMQLGRYYFYKRVLCGQLAETLEEFECPVQATPQKMVLEPSPSKGFGKLSPARWGWGKGSKKAAGRNLAAETCSPLRDGASAMTHCEANSQTPKGRRRLSPKKMSPWLGK